MGQVTVKGKSNLYNNKSWDLVDAIEDKDGQIDKVSLAKIDKKTLPDSLQLKNNQELEKIVTEKSKERKQIQKEIEDINTQREAFIATEKKKNATKNNAATLETEVEKIIKEQARRFNMIIQ